MHNNMLYGTDNNMLYGHDNNITIEPSDKTPNYLKICFIIGFIILSLAIILQITIPYGTMYPHRKTRNWILGITLGLFGILVLVYMIYLIIKK